MRPEDCVFETVANLERDYPGTLKIINDAIKIWKIGQGIIDIPIGKDRELNSHLVEYYKKFGWNVEPIYYWYGSDYGIRFHRPKNINQPKPTPAPPPKDYRSCNCI